MLRLQYKIADRLVYSKLRATFGGKLKFFISGSAPLSAEIAAFFHASNILILEGYGLTESSAASFINLPSKFKFGTVGFPLPGVEYKLAEADDEILISIVRFAMTDFSSRTAAPWKLGVSLPKLCESSFETTCSRARSIDCMSPNCRNQFQVLAHPNAMKHWRIVVCRAHRIWVPHTEFGCLWHLSAVSLQASCAFHILRMSVTTSVFDHLTIHSMVLTLFGDYHLCG